MDYTENNHPIMRTVVETFVIEETAELIYDNEKLQAWNDMVSELGLEGQKKIVSVDKCPIPFMFLNENMRAVFETLCPRKVPVKDYDKTPIPVEILDLVSLATREKHFNKIEIWYDDRTPDPACVGSVGHWYEMQYYNDSNSSIKNEQYGTEQEVKDAGGKRPNFSTTGYYLLGKWADVKHSMEELKERAKKRYKDEQSARLNQEIKASKNKLEELDNEVMNRFGS